MLWRDIIKLLGRLADLIDDLLNLFLLVPLLHLLFNFHFLFTYRLFQRRLAVSAVTSCLLVRRWCLLHFISNLSLGTRRRSDIVVGFFDSSSVFVQDVILGSWLLFGLLPSNRVLLLVRSLLLIQLLKKGIVLIFLR